MWVGFRRHDLALIVHYVGLLLLGIGAAMVVPFAVACVAGEWDAALDYLLGTGVTSLAGLTGVMVKPGGAPLKHAHALAIAALSWLLASAFAALPLALSGSYLSYLDAFFDAVSGLTTSGLTLVHDLDHMSLAHNMWRHLTHLIGGQGIVVAAIAFSVALQGGAFSLYLAEGREERIEPNVINTARFIWVVTAVYVALGTTALFVLFLAKGMVPGRALLHGVFASVACFDTGGFGPQSQNALYYHSWGFELITMLLMIAGTINFNLHAFVWRGRRGELYRNLEVRVLAANVAILAVLASVALAGAAFYSQPQEIVRKGLYHLVSAHSGTGHQTFYPGTWTTLFPGAAAVAVILAMAAGGSASSTAGGIKALRVGLFAKNALLQVRRQLAPESAHIVSHYQHLKRRRITPELVAAAMLVILLYLLTYVTGGLVGVALGYGPVEAMFESVSATANVGLSTGITSPSMPVALKIFYILQMWVGRLEFLTVFALFAAVVLAFRPGRKVQE